MIYVKLFFFVSFKKIFTKNLIKILTDCFFCYIIITSTLCADIFNLITKNNLPKKVDYFL